MNEIMNAQQLTNYKTSLQGQMSQIQRPTANPIDEVGNSFSDYFWKAIEKLDQSMQVMNQDTKNVITGEESDLAQVMIHMTEAQLTLQTATQIRNKCLEAYNEIKSMQF